MKLSEYQMAFVLNAAQQIDGRSLHPPPAPLVPEGFVFDAESSRAKLTESGWRRAQQMSAAKVKNVSAKVTADQRRLSKLVSTSDYSVESASRISDVALRLYHRTARMAEVRAEQDRISLRYSTRRS